MSQKCNIRWAANRNSIRNINKAAMETTNNNIPLDKELMLHLR
jgi:hypothetical protein